VERRSFLLSSLGLAAAGALPPAAFAESTKITIGFQESVAAALPYFIGVEKGFFKNAGIDVTLVKYSDQIKVVEHLVSGRIDGISCGVGTATEMNGELASPGLFKILVSNVSSETSILDELLVAKDSPIKHIADLKGKKVACQPGAQAINEFREILEKNGLGDTNIIQLRPSEHIAALGDGRADAAYTYEPNGTAGRLDGKVDVLEVGLRSKYILGSGTAPWFGGSGVLSTDWIAANPSSTKKLLAGIRKSVEFIRGDYASARDTLITYTGISKRIADAVPPVSYLLASEFKASDIGYFQKALDFYYDKKMLSQRVNVSGMLFRG
jgi:NitT/TauT family transport system substrate-binding protein